MRSGQMEEQISGAVHTIVTAALVVPSYFIIRKKEFAKLEKKSE